MKHWNSASDTNAQLVFLSNRTRDPYHAYCTPNYITVVVLSELIQSERCSFCPFIFVVNEVHRKSSSWNRLKTCEFNDFVSGKHLKRFHGVISDTISQFVLLSTNAHTPSRVFFTNNYIINVFVLCELIQGTIKLVL